ncbi:peptide-methionine (S)-S-oxide reductase MsrA [Marinivivus vitaminiproducens]|uniref:peptide-methionine (S)-S-oxide reductase MsrA n=1 Tax=Marinivivus vitaminiproducens TaxID=3035935 RepID=UPI00279EE834|nr:peptide-methionine (S)-S-oxide reductase MsrA [Geminicoccaceae bacterium SCSIO 64248]
MTSRRSFPLLARAAAIVVLGGALAAGLMQGAGTVSAETATAVPPPVFAYDEPRADRAVVVLAGGCFWGVQGVFQHVEGVTGAVSGYAGGSAESAQYRAVSGGRTGHAEAVEVTYDPARIDLGTLLQVYFSVAHDPTEVDRQGPDVGTQYRSAIFPMDAAQADAARAYIGAIDKAGVFDDPVATTIEADGTFYPAEAYHQDYMTRNPDQPYIRAYDLPKVENLKAMFPALYRETPVLVASAQG